MPESRLARHRFIRHLLALSACCRVTLRSKTGWAAASLLIAALLGSPAWAAPLVRVEDLPHLLQLPIFQPGEPRILYDDVGQAFASIVPDYRVFIPLSRLLTKLRRAVIVAE